MKTLAFGLLTVVALVLVIGTAGALENNTIGLFQAVIQGALAVGLGWFSIKKMEM